jgi:hypothetical protein
MVKTEHLKLLIPPKSDAGSFMTLSLKHAGKASDVSIAAMIYHLPNLEVINLKGCSLAGPKVVETVIKRCKKLRRINLKFTQVKEKDVKLLLDEFGDQLEVFKVNMVIFEVSCDLGYMTSQVFFLRQSSNDYG